MGRGRQGRLDRARQPPTPPDEQRHLSTSSGRSDTERHPDGPAQQREPLRSGAFASGATSFRGALPRRQCRAESRPIVRILTTPTKLFIRLTRNSASRRGGRLQMINTPCLGLPANDFHVDKSRSSTPRRQNMVVSRGMTLAVSSQSIEYISSLSVVPIDRRCAKPQLVRLTCASQETSAGIAFLDI